MQGTHIHILQPPPPPRSSIFSFYTCFLSSSPPPNLLRKSLVPRRRSLTSFGHFSGANRFIQEKTTNHVPVGASPASPSTYWAPAPPGTPHIHTHKPRSWGRGLGGRANVLTPALNTADFATALRHFGFPRTAGALWERGATPGPNGSSPGPRGAGTAPRARKNTASCVSDRR